MSLWNMLSFFDTISTPQIPQIYYDDADSGDNCDDVTLVTNVLNDVRRHLWMFLGRSVYRQLFCRKLPDRNELFLPGRMAYVVDLEDDFTESDVPTTLIRSKADCPSLEVRRLSKHINCEIPDNSRLFGISSLQHVRQLQYFRISVCLLFLYFLYFPIFL